MGAAVEEVAPDRDSEVAGRAGALEDQVAERARVGAAARVRAEAYGKRGRPLVEVAGLVVEGGQVRVARVEGPAAAELGRAGRAEMDRGVEGQVVVEDLAAELDLADRAVVDLGVGGQVVEEDLAAELDRAGRAVVGLGLEGRVAVEDLERELDRAGQAEVDRAEVQVRVAEPEGEAGWLEKSASGAQPQQCCATPWRGEFRECQEWVPQVRAEAAAPTR